MNSQSSTQSNAAWRTISQPAEIHTGAESIQQQDFGLRPALPAPVKSQFTVLLIYTCRQCSGASLGDWHLLWELGLAMIKYVTSAKFNLFLHPPYPAFSACLMDKMSAISAGLFCHHFQKDCTFIDGSSGGQSETRSFLPASSLLGGWLSD